MVTKHPGFRSSSVCSIATPETEAVATTTKFRP